MRIFRPCSSIWELMAAARSGVDSVMEARFRGSSVCVGKGLSIDENATLTLAARGLSEIGGGSMLILDLAERDLFQEISSTVKIWGVEDRVIVKGYRPDELRSIATQIHKHDDPWWGGKVSGWEDWLGPFPAASVSRFEHLQANPRMSQYVVYDPRNYSPTFDAREHVEALRLKCRMDSNVILVCPGMNDPEVHMYTHMQRLIAEYERMGVWGIITANPEWYESEKAQKVQPVLDLTDDPL